MCKNLAFASLFMSFAFFAAMRCSGESGQSNSSTSDEIDTFGDGMPSGAPMGHMGSDGKATRQTSGSGSDAGSGFSLPEGPLGVAGVILGLIGLVAGCVLLYRGNLRWGIPFALAGLAAFVAVLGWGGLTLSPPWEWHIVFWVLSVAWIVAKATAFTRIDDFIVVIGSLGMLVLSFVARGILGRYAPGSPLWWVLECAWVFLIAEAIWRAPALQTRPLARFGSLAVGWIILGVLS